MGRSKPDDVKVTTGGGLSVMGEVTLSSGGKTVKLGGNPTEHLLPAKRMERALTKLQDAMSAIKLAVEELAIVDAEMIGSDANRRVTVEASKDDPIKVSDDIESHRMQAAEIAGLAAEVAKTAKVVKGKAAFLGQALGSVYSSELLEGDRAREKAKDKQAKLFPAGSEEG